MEFQAHTPMAAMPSILFLLKRYQLRYRDDIVHVPKYTGNEKQTFYGRQTAFNVSYILFGPLQRLLYYPTSKRD